MNFNFNHYKTNLLVGVFTILLLVVSLNIYFFWNIGLLWGTSPTVIVLFIFWLYDQYG